MEPKKIICHKPGPLWPRSLDTYPRGLHPYNPDYLIRHVSSNPVVCSALGHDTSFRDGVKDECRTCGVEW